MQFHTDADLEIGGLSFDSRTVQPGDAYFALRGAVQDGHDHIAQAVENGAACVICERVPEAEIPYVLAPDTHAALSFAASAWYGEPSEKIEVIGVTGTNGKTSTTYLLRDILQNCTGEKVGVIGTNGNEIDGVQFPTSRTTPDALSVQKLLYEMQQAGCRYAVMEVSSHALCQKRVAAVSFAVGIFANLTRDHLDYHGTMEAYAAAKAMLFPLCRHAAINTDDEWGEKMAETCPCPFLTFGQNITCDIVAWRTHYTPLGVSFTACDDEEHCQTEIPIPGEFSLYNALGVLSAAKWLGIPLSRSAAALPQCHGVRGRCEIVHRGDVTVIVDYAHTPDGLRNILTAVNGIADERVITVFGCGGDRDRGKRAEMGRIAAALSDFCVLTSDNPRTENPYAILHGILDGMAQSETPFAVLENRRDAIHFALRTAHSGDVVLLAGKGHETYQTVGKENRPMDERQIVWQYYAARGIN